MGSTTPPSLPDKSSPSLILTQPTDAERRRTWSATHPLWGPALAHEDYVNREVYLGTVPLAKNGGLTQWILTDPSLPPDERPILSSCETLRKRALRTRPDGSVVDGIAHGIGAVFTDPQFRGRGYANRMMRDLGPRLRAWQGEDKKPTHAPDDILFSVLYSDIGKTFYAKTGWAPFASSHVAFAPVPGASCGLAPQDGYRGAKARPIGYHELAELCCADEKLLRAGLAKKAAESEGRTAVALLPDLDQLLWHLMREDYMTKHIFGRTPSVRGAVYGTPGKRVWAVWTRAYYGGLESMEGNTLHMLRVVAEDEAAEEEYLVEGFRSIVQIAQAEAAEWRLQEVQMWNPTETLRRVVDGCGVECRYVDRDSESIASLMWYGEGKTEGLEWVANEKFGWC